MRNLIEVMYLLVAESFKYISHLSYFSSFSLLSRNHIKCISKPAKLLFLDIRKSIHTSPHSLRLEGPSQSSQATPDGNHAATVYHMFLRRGNRVLTRMKRAVTGISTGH